MEDGFAVGAEHCLAPVFDRIETHRACRSAVDDLAVNLFRFLVPLLVGGERMKEMRIGSIHASLEKDTLRLFQSGIPRIYIGLALGVALVSPIAVITIINFDNPNSVMSMGGCVVGLVLFAWMTVADYGFTPIVFDRRADRILRRGETIGNFGNACTILIESHIPDVDTQIYSYHIYLILSRKGTVRNECIRLGRYGGKAEVLRFANMIAEFLGVEVSEGISWMARSGHFTKSPTTPTKPVQEVEDVDLEW